MAGISVGIDDDFAAGQAGIAIGPPMVKRPVGLIRNRVFSSISSGRNGFADHLINDGSGKCLMADFGRMLVETTTVSTRTGLSPSYSIVT